MRFTTGALGWLTTIICVVPLYAFVVVLCRISHPLSFLLAAFSAAGGTAFLLAAIKRKVYIGADYVQITTLTKSIYLKLEDILGYTTEFESRSLAYFLVPRDNPQTRVHISDQLGNSVELTTWIRSHLTDQTSKLAKAAKEVILKDSRYGSSREKRQRFLRRAGNAALIFNITTPIIALLTVFFQAHLGAGILVIPLFPIVGTALVLLSKGLVEFRFTPQPPHKSLAMGYTFAPILFLPVPFIHYPNFTNNGLAPVFIPTALLLATIILIISGRSFWGKPNSNPSLVVVIFSSFVLAYSSIRCLNCYLDRAILKDVALTVNGKVPTSNERGSISYTVYFLTPNAIDLREMDVQSNRFPYLKEGDTMHVILHPGAFGIPWYELAKQ